MYILKFFGDILSKDLFLGMLFRGCVWDQLTHFYLAFHWLSKSQPPNCCLLTKAGLICKGGWLIYSHRYRCLVFASDDGWKWRMSYLFFSEKKANGVCGGSPVIWLHLCLPGRWSLHAQCLAHGRGCELDCSTLEKACEVLWSILQVARKATHHACPELLGRKVSVTGGGSILRLRLSWRGNHHCVFREGFHSFKDLFFITLN